jgi:hypothetical protein
MLFNLAILCLLVFAFILEEFIPSVELAHHARLFVAPAFFFCAAVAVPFSMMLLLAFLTGIIWDARYIPLSTALDSGAEQIANVANLTAQGAGHMSVSSGMDLRMGYSIILFACLGALMQGIRPLFKRGRWEFPVFMVGIVTMVWLLLQYLLLSFLRESFFFPDKVWVKTISITLMTMLASPLIFLILHTLARATNYQIKYEGLRYRFNGG